MCFKNLRLVPTLIASVGFAIAMETAGQTFTTLHNFSAMFAYGAYDTNNDGANPYGSLILSGNTLYGTAVAGGSYGRGTVFKLEVDGTGFETLHNFDGTNGEGPWGSLVLSYNSLYGITTVGGTSNNGTVFKVDADGTAFVDLHDFTGGCNGDSPEGTLLLSGSSLYGTTVGVNGTVFKINIDGTGFTILHSFSNSDGAYPLAGLVLSSNVLYGTTSSGEGTIFAVNTDGTGFKNLHTFTDNDGGAPQAGLILSGNSLYGTTLLGGNLGGGTVFTLGTDSTDFKTLHSFSSGYLSADGNHPYGGLFLSGTTLYGTTSQGGSGSKGTIFQVNTDGAGFRVLHSFSGAGMLGPFGALILSGRTLYGTFSGASDGTGSVFSLSLAPELTTACAGTNLILTWPTNFIGFSAQSTTNLASSVWTTNLPAPVIINGQYTVANPISGSQQFFRLSH